MAHAQQGVQRGTFTHSQASTSMTRERVVGDEVTSKEVSGVSRAQQFVLYALDVLEVLFLFRFALKLFGANPQSGFAAIVDGVTAPFMAPFADVFQSVSRRGYVFEWSVLVAMAVYALLVYGVLRFIAMSTHRGGTAATEE